MSERGRVGGRAEGEEEGKAPYMIDRESGG